MAISAPPQYVKSVLMNLEFAHFQAYLVGGCVRDMLLGRRPTDWDICTNALPDEVLAVFPGALPTGLKHGTVTVKSSGHHIEVTTFRTDGAYTDHRRPNSVSFIPDLKGDLERRDFTMNAIALPLSGKISDPFGGRKDINSGLIRCVGDPALRFEEDALRMLRALRFSAQLGFEIEPGTRAAIAEKHELAESLAPERVSAELEKILMSPNPSPASDAIALHLLDSYLDSTLKIPNFSQLSSLPRQRQQRWAGFCAMLSSAGLADDTAAFLKKLRLDNGTIKNCALAVDIAVTGHPKDSLSIKRLLSRYGTDAMLCAASAADALESGGYLKAVKRVLKGGDCFSLKRLAINGDSLSELGFEGKALGAALHALLEHVLEHPEDNDNATLMSLAFRIREAAESKTRVL